MPRVSVVLPTFERADLLPRAVASVLAQTYTDLELLVVDDGSADGTAALASAWGDPRVDQIRIEHSGVSVARNVALERARGTWVAFLDDDNEWLPTFLERVVERLEATGADAAYARGERRDHTGKTLAYWPEPCDAPDDFARLLTDWHPYMSALVLRRSLVDEIGRFAPELAGHEDFDFLLRVTRRTPLLEVPCPLVIRYEELGPALSKNAALRARSFTQLDRMWRAAMIERVGTRRYRRWLAEFPLDVIVDSMMNAPVARRRAAARTALAQLGSRLPWSAGALPYPLLLLALGPDRYDRLRHGYVRARRAASRRRPARPSAGQAGGHAGGPMGGSGRGEAG
jgi:glycosyltransferase involved in cell wall biosynthesis